MKYGTSSCKRRALGKDLRRFWPVWAGYVLFLIFLQIVQSSSNDLTYWYAANLAGFLPAMGLVNLVYALTAAQMLFGDLYSPRMCSGLHALPLKREHWFGAHVRAGLLFSLIPTALMAVFSQILIQLFSTVTDGWQIPALWWVNTNLQYLFFFGLAVFCAMCAGNRLAMTMLYGMVNGFSLLLLLLVDSVCTPLLPGVVTQTEPFELLCPMARIVNTMFIDCSRVPTGRTYPDEAGILQREMIGQFRLLKESWIYVAVLAALGILLLLAARRLYKKRKLECAGDFLSAAWPEPVFQVCFTVLCAAGFHGIFYLFFGSSRHTYAILLLGLVAGWFVGRMFLERTTRVFRLKNFAGLLLLTVLLAGCLYTVRLDPLGIAAWTPRPEEVTQASLGLSHQTEFTTEDPEQTADLIRLHRLAIENGISVHPDYDGAYYSPSTVQENAFRFTLTYRRPNGWISQREYTLRAEGEAADIVRRYCSRLDTVIHHTDVKDVEDLRNLLRKATTVQVHGHNLPREHLTEDFLLRLADAIAADAAAQTLVQSAVFHPGLVVEGPTADTGIHSLYLDIHGDEFFTYFNIYSDSANTLSLLESTGVLDTIRAEQEAYGTK